MTICEKIRTMRNSLSFTQKELGAKIGVSEVTIRNWESGAKLPSMQAIIDLSDAFNVSADYLLGLKDRQDLPKQFTISKSDEAFLEDYRMLDEHGKKMVRTVCSLERERLIKERQSIAVLKRNAKSHTRTIPLFVSPAAAGVSVPVDGDDYEMIPVENDVPFSADFAVKIQGDSMSPYISDGDTVYVRKLRDNLEIGDVGIFSVDGATYCKIFYADENNNITLVSANPVYKSSNVYIPSDSGMELTCFGKVILKHKIPFPHYFNT